MARKRRASASLPDRPTLADVSAANSHVGHMEELHGTDSPQHKDALATRQEVFRRWRDSRKDADGSNSAA